MTDTMDQTPDGVDSLVGAGQRDARPNELPRPDPTVVLQPAAGIPLPPGLAPMDRSQPTTDGHPDRSTPIPDDLGGDKFAKGRQRFGVENGEARGVFERASEAFSADRFVVTTTSGPIRITGTQKGKKAVTLGVGSTETNGVTFAEIDGKLSTGGGIALYPGDSWTLETEASVWIYVIGNATSGAVNVVVEFNPAGGSLGIQ